MDIRRSCPPTLTLPLKGGGDLALGRSNLHHTFKGGGNRRQIERKPLQGLFAHCWHPRQSCDNRYNEPLAKLLEMRCVNGNVRWARSVLLSAVQGWVEYCPKGAYADDLPRVWPSGRFDSMASEEATGCSEVRVTKPGQSKSGSGKRIS